MKKVLLFALLAFTLSCSMKFKKMTVGNINLQVPKGLQKQSLAIDNQIVELNSIYDSYIYKDSNAAYSIVYSKYKDEYSHFYNLYNSAKNSLNSMKNNPSFKNLEVVSTEEIKIDGVNAVVITTEFVYGIYTTRAKSLILVDDFMLQLICIYTKKHKASENTVNDMIKSIRIDK